MNFSPTVDLGSILSLLGCLGTLIFFAWRISNELGRMQLKLDLIWDWFLREHANRPVFPDLPRPERTDHAPSRPSA